MIAELHLYKNYKKKKKKKGCSPAGLGPLEMTNDGFRWEVGGGG